MNSQSSYIAATLIIGFVVFITVRGEIPKYKNVLFANGEETKTNSSQTANNPLATPNNPLSGNEDFGGRVTS